MRRRSDLFTSSRCSVVDLPPDAVRAVVASGRPGPHWYVDAAPILFRSAVDRLTGGAGSRWPAPGRALLESGDRVGFWSVTTSTPGELRLRAEVRAPGVVELVTRLSPQPSGTRIEQEVSFIPTGVLGACYLVADLPAREAVIELVHRRLVRDLRPRP